MYCKNCGNTVADGLTHCDVCGAEILSGSQDRCYADREGLPCPHADGRQERQGSAYDPLYAGRDFRDPDVYLRADRVLLPHLGAYVLPAYRKMV